MDIVKEVLNYLEKKILNTFIESREDGEIECIEELIEKNNLKVEPIETMTGNFLGGYTEGITTSWDNIDPVLMEHIVSAGERVGVKLTFFNIEDIRVDKKMIKSLFIKDIENIIEEFEDPEKNIDCMARSILEESHSEYQKTGLAEYIIVNEKSIKRLHKIVRCLKS